MTDAPERIWVDTSDDAIRANGRPYVTQGYLASPPRTEYLRADLCDRNAILEEAAKVAERYSAAYAVPPPSDMDNDEAEYFLEGARDGATAVAAAIRAMKEAK